MARKVKCTICKLEGTNETFIAVPKITRGNYYFCSQEHVNEHEYQELENRKRKWILDYIAKCIDYDNNKHFPNSINKELKRIREMYEYDVIYKCLYDGAETIKWKATKGGGWDTDWGMTRYIFSIIESKLNDTVKAMNRDEMLMEKVEEQASNIAEAYVINDIDISTEIVSPKKSNHKSIASFLDEEDL